MIRKQKQTAFLLCNLSLVIYLVWILLPTLQEALHSWPGVLAAVLLGTAMVLDTQWLREHWWKVLISIVCILALAFAGALLLRHGVNNTRSFLVSRCMFFYPILLAGYALTVPGFRLWKHMRSVLILCVSVTALITLFWNVEGFFDRMENESIRTYSRLIYDRRVDTATIASYNLRGIGSLPFIYAQVFLLPVIFIWIERSSGKARLGYILFLILNVLTILSAQFTFALVFTAILLWEELLSLLLCKIGKGKIKRGLAMLLALIPLLLLLLFLPSITDFAYTFAKQHKLSFIRSALKGLYNLTRDGLPGILSKLSNEFAEICANPIPTYLENGEWNDPGRIPLYMMSLSGFVKSPWIGSMGGSPILTGYHSDLLDSLSACGLLGTALMSAMVIFLLRPQLHSMAQSRTKAHFGLLGMIALLTTLFTTYLCCRELSAALVAATLPMFVETASLHEILPHHEENASPQ